MANNLEYIGTLKPEVSTEIVDSTSLTSGDTYFYLFNTENYEKHLFEFNAIANTTVTLLSSNISIVGVPTASSIATAISNGDFLDVTSDVWGISSITSADQGSPQFYYKCKYFLIKAVVSGGTGTLKLQGLMFK